jgi:elongation factor Ts
MGWSKATKLEGRSTKQGLVGVLVQKNIGAILEVNCETDFVARNNTFREFVLRASEACAKYVTPIDSTNITKIVLEGDSLKNLTTNEGKTLADELALMIGTVGENSVLRRALCYKTPESIELCSFSHPVSEEQLSGNFSFGKYGVIGAFSPSEGNEEIQQIQRKICQHIIGMNPKKIGDPENDKPNQEKDNEECLIFQEFVLDPDATVGEILEENNMKIFDFHRFECGENIEMLEK